MILNFEVLRQGFDGWAKAGINLAMVESLARHRLLLSAAHYQRRFTR